MIKAAFVILLFVAVGAWEFDLSSFGASDPTEEQFQSLFKTYMWIAPYFAQETPERFNYFKSQVLSIIYHNRNPHKTWTRKVNVYTGLTMSELAGFAVMDSQVCKSSESFSVSFAQTKDYPSSFDWRDHGVVAPIKNQGKCGSGWAFAAAAAIESHWAIYTKDTPTLLSEQQLIDCSISYNNQGCTSGFPSQAYQYVKDIGGINTENTYPYLMEPDSCVFNLTVIGAQVINGAVDITTGDENAIIQALVTYGPVSVVFDATDDFLSYQGGVYVGKTCGKSSQVVNHAAVIVGYGTDSQNGIEYWICKNSWGASWGEDGYFRIQRGVNMCGIADCASFPSMTSTEEFIPI